MDLYSLATNTGSAELILNLSLQVIIVSLAGWIIMKLWRPRSAPARSAGYLAVLISIAILPVLTVMFNTDRIAWFQSTIELPHSSINQLSAPVQKISILGNAGIKDNNQDEIVDGLYNETSPSFTSSDQNSTRINKTSVKEQHETLHNMYDKTGSAKLPNNRIPIPDSENQKKANVTGNKQDEIPVSLYERIGSYFFTRDRVLLAVNIFGAIWIAGFIVFILRLGFKLSFLKGYMHNLKTDDRERLKKVYSTIMHVFKNRPMPEIYFSSSLSSPVTVGIIKPVMILPMEVEYIADDELKSILLHELAHIFHGDNFTGFFQHVLSSTFWWNPIVYRLNSEYSDSREDVCDNYAINVLKSPKKYAATLLNLAEKTCLFTTMPAAAGMSLSKKSLEHRVLGLLKIDRDLSTLIKPSFMLFSLTILILISYFGLGMRICFVDRDDSRRIEYSKESQKAKIKYTIDPSPGKGWQEKPEVPFNDFLFVLPDKDAMIYVAGIPATEGSQWMAAEDFFRTWSEGMQNKYQYKDFTIESSGKTTVDGRESYYATYEFVFNFNRRKEKVYIIHDEKSFYRFRYAAQKNTFNENLQTFEKYVRSFKVGT